MTSWFRSWHGAPTDSKWLVIAKRANVAPGMVSAVFWALLDTASQADERGSVADFDAETYALWAGFEEHQVCAVIDAMRAKGVIEADGRLHAWDKRQPKREDDSTERVRRHRERKNAESNGDNGGCNGVTQCNELQRNGTHVTHTDKNRTEQNREDIVVVVAPAPPEIAPAAEPAPTPAPAPTKEAATAAVFRCWQDNMPGTLTALIADDVGDLIDTYGADAVIRAIGEAARANVRNLRYVSGILKNWAAGNTKPHTNNGNGRGPSKVAQSLASVDAIEAMLAAQGGAH